jgi:hypothetical protein
MKLISRAILLGMTVGLILLAARQVRAYPEPAIVSPSWALDFTFTDPKPISVRDIRGQIRWYWYTTYQVLNKSGDERQFIPEITVATDSGKIIAANHGIPVSVFDAIKEQVGNPLLESPLEIVGTILLGEDYAKEGVAIWRAFDHDVDEIRLFFAGLSGESAAVKNPITGEPVNMRRTRMIRFKSPGNHTHPQKQPIVLLDQIDVMR